jgi:hypothetical protein
MDDHVLAVPAGASNNEAAFNPLAHCNCRKHQPLVAKSNDTGKPCFSARNWNFLSPFPLG